MISSAKFVNIHGTGYGTPFLPLNNNCETITNIASLKKNSTWYAVWYQNGKQIVRSSNVPVKGPKEKKLAQNAADAMESLNLTMTLIIRRAELVHGTTLA